MSRRRWQGATHGHARRRGIDAKHKQEEQWAAGLSAEKIEQPGDREIEQRQPREGDAHGQPDAERIMEQVVPCKREHEHPDREGDVAAGRHEQRDQ